MRIALSVLLALTFSGLGFTQTKPGSKANAPSQAVTGPVIRVYRVGGDVEPPRPIDVPEPKWTEEEKKQSHKTKFKGVVALLIVVGEDGRVRDVHVTRSRGSYLESKAVEAVKAWKFEPATRKGQPVPVQIAVEVNFRLY